MNKLLILLGSALNDRYMKMRTIEAKMKLYSKVGAGDKVIVTKRAILAPKVSPFK